MSITVRSLYPVYCMNVGVGHTCLSLCDAMRAPGFHVRLTVPTTEPRDRREFVCDAVPSWLRSLSCRAPLRHVRHWCTQRQFVRQLRPGQIAYLWPAVSVQTYEEIKALGNLLVMERINCHRATARRLLDEASQRLGWPSSHGITDADIEEESRKLSLADYVFCPSPFVRQSMIDAGVRADKLLSASYGWDPLRFQGTHRALPEIEGLTVVFVGVAGLRKGTPLLLEAWARAKIKGRLVLAGEVAPEVVRHCADALNRPDVACMHDSSDVGAVYRSADVFVLPTLEEGSPLVSYEAMATGLPSILSPMGAGEVVRDGLEGLVRPAHDVEAWIEALQQMACDEELRRSLGAAARVRAAEYTWLKAGARRRDQLEAVASLEAVAA